MHHDHIGVIRHTRRRTGTFRVVIPHEGQNTRGPKHKWLARDLDGSTFAGLLEALHFRGEFASFDYRCVAFVGVAVAGTIQHNVIVSRHYSNGVTVARLRW